MNVEDWTLPCSPDTYARVVTCTNDGRDFATMICTFIDVWAKDHGIDCVDYANHIAYMIKRKRDLDAKSKT